MSDIPTPDVSVNGQIGDVTAAEDMAKVLDEHWGCISSSGGTATEWTFSCGITVRLDAPGSYAEFHRVHVADALAAVGYGLLADSANYSLGYRSAVATLDSRAEKAEAERDRLTVDLSLLSKSCGHWKRSAEKAEADVEKWVELCKGHSRNTLYFKDRALAAEAKTADVLADLRALADEWERHFPLIELRALIERHETGGNE